MKLLKTALGFFLENIVNTAIQLDSDHERILGLTQGKALAISLIDFKIRLVLRPLADNSRLSLMINQDTPAEAEIAGTMTNLLKLAFSETPQALLASKIVLLKGDVAVLQNYQTFLQSLDLDWEGRLSDLIGPTAAAEIGKRAKQAREFQKRSWASSQQDLSEFLTEEAKLLPSKKEVENFYQELRKLRLDIERLEAQINRQR